MDSVTVEIDSITVNLNFRIKNFFKYPRNSAE
jgi:hypothetical protein